MSLKLPRVTARELLRALYRVGWVDSRQTGSHLILRHPTRPGTVTVPIHARVIVKPKTLATILDQAGLSPDELRDLL